MGLGPRTMKGLQAMKAHLKSKYRLTIDEYVSLCKKQNHRCKICRNECSFGTRLSVDHCHKTGMVRGLLCRKCNLGIGLFNHDPEILDAAWEYVKQSEVRGREKRG